jgi:hypothetical protein
MAKKKLRKIVIGGHDYLWGVKTEYIRKQRDYPDYETHITFSAYLEGYKNTPLIIHFLTWESVSGNPLTSGCGEFSLHWPSVVKVLILGGISEGWDGRQTRLTIEDGQHILERGGYNVSEI